MALEPMDVKNIIVWLLKLAVAAFYYTQVYSITGERVRRAGSRPTLRHHHGTRSGSVVHVPLLHRGLAEPREGIRARALEGRLSK